jgi:hypothetical protein
MGWATSRPSCWTGPIRQHRTQVPFRYRRLPYWESGAWQQDRMFEVVVESWMLLVGSGLTVLYDQEEGYLRRRLERVRDLFCVVVRLSLGLQVQ